MDKIALIKAEIERLYDGEAPKHDQQCDFDDGYFTGIGAISQFLDTLSKEPDKSLKEVAEKYADETYYAYPPEFLDFAKEEIRDAYITGAKWQKEQMMKEAIPCKVFWHDGPLLDYTQEQQDNALERIDAHVGDKVRIIIVKGGEN